MKITDFVRIPTTLKGDQFEKLSKGKTKEEIRKLEMALFKPDRIVHKEIDGGVSISDKTVKMYFSSDEEIELFKKAVKVNTYKGLNVSGKSILPIVCFLKALVEGKVKYNPSNNSLITIIGDKEYTI